MNGEPLRILLVEDDEAHAEIAKRNLAINHLANKVFHVRDGQEALDFLFNQNNYSDKTLFPKPHIILLDLRLPKVDGIEVLEAIKKDEIIGKIPVVILTTSAAENDIARAYTHHVSSYLVKPLDFDKFTQLIETFGYYWLAWNKYPF